MQVYESKHRVFFVVAILSARLVSGKDYFVTDIAGKDQTLNLFGSSRYGGVSTYENLNLLATLLGDNPGALLQSGQTLISTRPVVVEGQTVQVQPFVFTTAASGRMKNLPVGPLLKKFLDDPLNGERFDLTLPFTDSRVALSDRSGFIRLASDSPDSDYHTAIDFDRSDGTRNTFDVVAAADGVIQNSQNSGSIAIIHTTPRGKEFLTIYQHLDPDSKRHLADGARIKRGDKIGVLQDKDDQGQPIYTHLHFGVGVKGPSGVIGGVQVPELWYLIDPLGVYEERRNRFSDNAYNYLPDNNNVKLVRGVEHVFVFMTNPISGSFFYGPEDCVPIWAENLRVRRVSSTSYDLTDGTSVMRNFRSVSEAGKVLQVIKRYKFRQACYVNRPNPVFEYFKD